jgi:hypothetical protein
LLFRRCNGVHITAPTHETIVFFRDTRLTCSSADVAGPASREALTPSLFALGCTSMQALHA